MKLLLILKVNSMELSMENKIVISIVKLADSLDSKGFYREANEIDEMISSEINEDSLWDITVDKSKIDKFKTEEKKEKKKKRYKNKYDEVLERFEDDELTEMTEYFKYEMYDLCYKEYKRIKKLFPEYNVVMTDDTEIIMNPTLMDASTSDPTEEEIKKNSWDRYLGYQVFDIDPVERVVNLTDYPGINGDVEGKRVATIIGYSFLGER